MTAIYITLAVLVYLLIGSVVAGLLIRSDNKMADDCWVGIIGWPMMLILFIPVIIFYLFILLAKRIGGVR